MTDDAPVTRPDLDALIDELGRASEHCDPGWFRNLFQSSAAALAAERARADQATSVVDAVRKWRTNLGEGYAGPSGIILDLDDAMKSAAPTAEQEAN